MRMLIIYCPHPIQMHNDQDTNADMTYAVTAINTKGKTPEQTRDLVNAALAARLRELGLNANPPIIKRHYPRGAVAILEFATPE